MKQPLFFCHDLNKNPVDAHVIICLDQPEEGFVILLVFHKINLIRINYQYPQAVERPEMIQVPGLDFFKIRWLDEALVIAPSLFNISKQSRNIKV